MAEPTSTVTITAGAGLVTAATLIFGSVLGEYSIILAMSILGTLVALSEAPLTGFWQIFWFLFRGIALGFAFGGVLTNITVSFLPSSAGITPYTLLGTVSFCIGWISPKTDAIKDRIITWLGGNK